jgi:hypothetical protein
LEFAQLFHSKALKQLLLRGLELEVWVGTLKLNARCHALAGLPIDKLEHFSFNHTRFVDRLMMPLSRAVIRGYSPKDRIR